MKPILKLLTIALLIGACSEKEVIEEKIIIEPKFEAAVATLNPVGDSDVSGVVRFGQRDEGVRVIAEISGLSPGKHGFHIHKYGDCTAVDGTSAGGHFNPTGKEHSSPDAMNRHMGDMGNIEANANGVAQIDYIDKSLQVSMLVGRGVIVHGGEDDLSSQPSGAAGPRVGCGVVGIANE
jgi:Cu-Zn family superoxide dismutase